MRTIRSRYLIKREIDDVGGFILLGHAETLNDAVHEIRRLIEAFPELSGSTFAIHLEVVTEPIYGIFSVDNEDGHLAIEPKQGQNKGKMTAKMIGLN